jgi:hypothetical protein
MGRQKGVRGDFVKILHSIGAITSWRYSCDPDYPPLLKGDKTRKLI